MCHSGDGRTDWCRMTLSFWDSGLWALLFWNEWIVYLHSGGMIVLCCDCARAPRALSFPHHVSSTNIISFTQLLLYFNPTSSLSIICPLSVQMSRTVLEPRRPRGAADAGDSTLLFNSAPSPGSHEALILLQVAPWKVIVHFFAAATSWFSYLKKKQKTIICIRLRFLFLMNKRWSLIVDNSSDVIK